MKKPLRVLLLEDSEDDALLAVRELRRWGFEPDWSRVETEPDYLAHLEPTLDLILADYNLPQFDALKALHRLQERGLDIPFIVVTGALGDERAVECLKQGATDYLLKDRLARLGPAVTLALELKRVRDDKRRAVEALARSEQRYRSFVTASAQVVWTTDPIGEVDCEIPEWQAYTGQTAEEARGLGWMNAIHPEDHSRVAEAWRTAYTSRRLYEVEYRLRLHDGTWRQILARGVPVLEPDGRIREWIGTCIDISERKQAVEALRQERDFADSLIETAQAIVVVLDTAGRVIRTNLYLEEISGYQRDEIRGKDWFTSFVSERKRARRREIFAQTIAGATTKGFVESHRHEVRARAHHCVVEQSAQGRHREHHRRPRHRTRHHGIEGRPGAGASIRTAGGHRGDDGRLVPREPQYPESRPSVPGDARPGGRGSARSPSPHRPAPEGARRPPHPLRGCPRLCGPHPPRPASVRSGGDLRAAWRHLVSLREGREDVLREESGGLDLHGLVDASRLEQVFRNILENSLAACRDPVEITIRCMPAEIDDHPALRIAVRDNGPGLNAEQGQKIFEPFFTTKTKGTGLGMSITKRIVEAHGGRIAVGEGAGPGAEIVLALPRGTQ